MEKKIFTKIKKFIYQKRITGSGKLLIKVCKIPVWNKRIQKNISFPKGAKSYEYKSEKFKLKKFHRVAIFASFFANGEIPDYVVFYLKGLKEVCDTIIFIADNPVFIDEINKIKDLVSYACFKRHKEYDFGSYKHGYQYAKQSGILAQIDELILCNDSCYGPMYPFEELFSHMDKKACDFWGVVANDDIRFHLQSYFLVFKKIVLQSGALHEFLSRVRKEKDFWSVVYKYEITLTEYLLDKGFSVSAFFPPSEDILHKLDWPSKHMLSLQYRAGHRNPTVWPLSLIRDYKFPLVKVKALTGGYGFALEESPKTVLDFIKDKNYSLYQVIVKHLKERGDFVLEDDVDAILSKVDVVSFDCSDTLLIRPYVKPTDLFKHVEEFYQASGFYKARIKAEMQARENFKNKEDITLDDIYNHIAPEFKKLKEKELFFEEKILKKYPKVFELYKKAVSLHKKIVVASDMYLPSSFLKHVLAENGYQHIDTVYVSGELNATKRSGHLFEKIMKDYHVAPSQVLHIGDNEYSDIAVPKNMGINTLHICPYIDVFNRYGGNRKYTNFYTKTPNLQSSMLLSMVAMGELTREFLYWEWIGYSFSGPLVLGYVQFIIEQAKKKKIDSLLFVARDGYLLQKVYNLLEHNPLPNYYIYAPRILNLKCFGDYASNPAYFEGLIAILSEQFNELSLCKDFNSQQKFLEDNQARISDFYKKHQEKYRQYLRSLNIVGSCMASVDMTTGAFTSEKFLMKFFKDKYKMGFFSAIFCNRSDLNYLSYMQKTINPDKQEGLMMFMELLVSAPESPIEDLQNAKPVYKEESLPDKERIDIIKQIEKGCLAFVHDYIELFGQISIKFDMDTILNLLDTYVHTLSCVDVSSLKKVKHATDILNDKYASLYDEIKKRL